MLDLSKSRLVIGGIVIFTLAQLAIGVTAHAQLNTGRGPSTESTITPVFDEAIITPVPTTGAILETPASVTTLPALPEAQHLNGDIIFFSDHAVYKTASNVVDAMASPPSKVSQVPVGTGPIFLAPDGQALAIATGVDIGWLIYVVDIRTGQTRPLFPKTQRPGFFLSWFPNSQDVLFWTDRGPGKVGLLIVDSRSGKSRQLVDTELPEINGQVDGATVHPDGKRVLFATWAGFGARGKMWSIDTDGSNLQLLFESEYPSYGLTWSPDGNLIAYIGDDGQGSYGLCIMRPDGTDRRLLSKSFSEGFGFMPVWSPDSKKIAFVARESPLEKPQDLSVDWDMWALKGNNIHIVDIETGEERRLLSDVQEGTIDPAWSPDGLMIAFISSQSGSPEIWTVNIDGTGLQQLTGDGKVKRTTLWLPILGGWR